MIECTFELNGKAMSSVRYGGLSFPAFSGLGTRANRREFACHPGFGPIPPGTYYILDRESGGMLGPLWDRINRRTDWFALYAIDGRIDDVTFCNKVERGAFRLHPKRGAGISQGCVVVDKESDFQRLRLILRSAGRSLIPGGKLGAYGRLVVR